MSSFMMLNLIVGSLAITTLPGVGPRLGNVGQTTPSTGRSRTSLPPWADPINRAMNFKLITHADKGHVHAVTGATWFVSSYTLLFDSLANEALSGDHTIALAHGTSGPVLIACAAGLAVAASGFPMTPSKRTLRAYAAQMQSSMLSVATCCMVLAAHSVNEASLPEFAISATHALAGASIVGHLIDFTVEQKPWNQVPSIIDLKLKMPPTPIIRIAQTVSLGWCAMALACFAHAALGGPEALSNVPLDEKGFAAQMTLAIIMAPASEAFIGTLVNKERFRREAANRVGEPSQNKFVYALKDDETGRLTGEFRPSHAMEAIELALNVPGPQIAAVAMALTTGHADAVRHFFFLG